MKKTDAPVDETYFAALEPDELLPAVLERKLMDIQDRKYTGYSELMFKAYNAYYGLDETGFRHLSSDLLAAGEQGELVKAKLNIFRNLIQHVLVMTTSDRPALEAKAVNSDPDSQEQAILASGIIEYYLRLRDVEKYLYNAAETALVCSQGYIELEWDPQEGNIITNDPETGDIVYDGDIRFYNLMPWDVFQDPEAVADSSSWILTRRWTNRYDLIAKSPSNKEKLLAAKCKYEVLQTERSTYRRDTRSTDPRSRDLVPLYTFYHKRTASLPQGRLVQFVDEETLISDTPLPYKTIPVSKISPSDKLDTVRGYANGFDVLAIQKARDGLASIALSNQNSQGVQKIWMPDTATPKYEQLATGLALIQSPPNAKPEVLQLTSTPAEVFKFMDTLGSEAETQMGVSSVTRGQPEASLRTGSALALVQSMSIQFNSAFQRSWVKLLESVGTGIIHILQTFATTERIALIAGEDKQSYLKAFRAADLDKIDRVTVTVGSPLAQTVAGRAEAARELLQNGLVQSPQAYFQVRETGLMSPVTRAPNAHNTLVARENAKLRRGEATPVMPTDLHHLHVQEHSVELGSPDVRQNQELVSAIMQHIQEHINAWASIDPNLAMALGIPPITPAAPEQLAPQNQPGATAALPEQPAPPQEAAGNPGVQPNQPQQPVNPATGQPVSTGQ